MSQLVSENQLTAQKVFSCEVVNKIENSMLQMPQAEASVIHRFGPNLYIRELFMPAGTFAIGHHQNFEHLNVFLKGKVKMFNEDGTTTILKAPMMFVGKPGRKMGYVLEDMVWQNIYSTPETDVEKLEAHFITKSDSWKYTNTLRQSSLKIEREKDREDYLKMLKEINVTENLVRSQSENTSDQLTIPLAKCIVSDSPIEGKGLFATANIYYGEIISIARISGKRTQAGRFTNHSATPNARMERKMGDIYLVAIKDIGGCVGGELGEEITIDYRQALSETMKELSCQQ
jgi:hypothetical protein